MSTRVGYSWLVRAPHFNPTANCTLLDNKEGLSASTVKINANRTTRRRSRHDVASKLLRALPQPGSYSAEGSKVLHAQATL